MPKQSYIICRVTDDEKVAVANKAKKFNLTTSSFVRKVLVDGEVPDPSNSVSITTLLQANADLARLGNLLLMGINEGSFTEEQYGKLFDDIRESQDKVKNVALKFGDRAAAKIKVPLPAAATK